MTQVLPPKKEVALALLERSNVDVYLDPRAHGVVVPPQFRKEPRLILKIGLNMPVPIPDLRVEEDSMSCTLSFNRSPFYCVVPWSGVFALVGEDGRGMVWPDDVPQELAVKVAPPSAEDGAASPSPASPGRVGGGGGRRPRGSKLAEDVPSRSSAERPSGRGRGAKKSSKKDDARPTLVAVPSQGGARDNVSVIPSLQNRGAQSSRVPPSDAPTPVPPREGRPESNRPKRELPPYLRVVK